MLYQKTACMYGTLLLVLFLLLPGCAKKKVHIPLSGKTDSAAVVAETKKILLAQYKEWHGVGYRAGGMDKAGVDCSGFVYLTYKRLGKVVPRTAAEMADSGTAVAQSSLLPGDLVLFKTGWFEHHAGIYMGERKFLHVSTRRGVIISSMDDYYWKDRLWLSRRILE